MTNPSYVSVAINDLRHESCRVCGSDEIVFNIRIVQGKEIRVRFCNACGAFDRL